MLQRLWPPVASRKRSNVVAVEQVLAGMDLVGDVAAGFVEGVEDRPPSPRQFGERRLDEPGRALRPGIDERPRQRAGKRRVRLETQAPRSLRGVKHLLHRPFLPLGRLAMHLRRRKCVKRLVVGRVHGDELALQMGRKLGDREPVARGDSLEFVAIGLRLARLWRDR